MSKKSDFNDLQELAGSDAVKEQIANAQPVAELDAKPWPKPRPLTAQQPIAAAFDLTLIPEQLRPWIQDNVDRMQCPPEFVVLPFIASLGAILGRKVVIYPKRYDKWAEYPNLWCMTVGHPGQMKSPAMDVGLEPLNELASAARKEFEVAQKHFEHERQFYEMKQKHLQKAVAKALDKGDHTRARALTKELQDAKPEEPIWHRYILNDATFEKVGEIQAKHKGFTNALAWVRDELTGLFETLSKPGREGDLSKLLESWSAKGSFCTDRISRGSLHIEHIALSIIGSIQPSVLIDLFKKSARKGAGNGLMQRFQLMAMPQNSSEYIHTDRAPDAGAAASVRELAAYMDKVLPEEMGADTATSGTPFLRFADDAQTVFDEWLVGLENRIRQPMSDPAFQAHISKYRKLVPSLALIFHAVGRHCGPVTLEATNLAIRFAGFLESHAQVLYALLHQETSPLADLVRHIRAGDLAAEFNLRDLQRHAWSGLTDRDVIQTALNDLMDANWIREKIVDTARPGRPSGPIYEVNPKIGGEANDQSSPQITPVGVHSGAELPPSPNIVRSVSELQESVEVDEGSVSFVSSSPVEGEKTQDAQPIIEEEETLYV